MNRIFAIVWNRARGVWVAVSELADRRQGQIAVRRRRGARRAALSLCVLACAVAADVRAQQIIGNSTNQQTLNSSTNYQLNNGTTASTTASNNAIAINGISPYTFTNYGRIIGTNVGGWAALGMYATGTIVNQNTGLIYGNTFGIIVDNTGSNNNIINRGDISVLTSHAINFTRSSSGTVDNYGTLNGGAAGTVSSSPNGMQLNTTGFVTINNHAGAVINSGVGNATWGNGIEFQAAGGFFINNAGRISGYHSAITSASSGAAATVTNSAGGQLVGNVDPTVRLFANSTLRNAGSISGSATAVSFDSTNNTLILEGTSSITGTVLGGTNGKFILGGSSPMVSFNLNNIGPSAQYRNFTVFEKWETGAWGIVGNGNQNWVVRNGLLALGNDSNLTGTSVTVDPGGTFQVGGNGANNSISNTILNNGHVDFFRGQATVYSQVISGTESFRQVGSGKLTLTGNHTFTGGTTVASGSVLQLGNAGTTGSVVGDIVDNGQLIFNRSDAVTYSNAVSGSGSFSHEGAGVLTLTGTNTYTGGTSIASGGTLQVGAGGEVGSIVGDIVNNGTLIANRSGNLNFDGVISGTGTLVKRGSGNLQLTGINTFNGATRFEAGVLSATVADNFGQLGNLLIFDGGTLRWLNPFFIGRHANLLAGGGTLDSNGLTVEWRSPTTGVGGLSKTGAGTVFLTGLNDYTGGTTVLDGTLRIGNGGTTGSLVGNINNAAAVVFNRSDTMSFGGLISGVGSVTQQGPGNLIFTGNHSYTGGTTISGGSLQLGDGGSTGGVQGNVLNNGLLIINRGDNVTDAAGLVSGSGGLTQAGTATLTFTRDHTYTGLTTISGGTLRLGNGGTTGAVAGDILNNATLIHDRSDLVSYAGSLSGSGTFLKQGGGRLTLTGNNPFAGTTLVSAGHLLVDGNLGGGVNVAGGATLGGVGVLGGLVSVANGGHLAPGDSPGTLTVGTLVLDATSQLDYELGLPDIVGGGVNDLTSVTGDLTLDGVLNITDLGGFGDGVYRLFDYGGALTDNGLLFGVMPLGFAASDFLLQTAIFNQVNLIVSQGGLELQFWDGPNEAGNGVIDGGTSIWNTLNSRWTNASGVVNAPWQNGFAVFQGSAGTVTLGENIALTGAQFITDGYVIEGAGFNLHSDASLLPLRVDPGVTATINAAIIDGSVGTQLVKRDTGTLVLGGNNTYSGGTVVEGGKLQISSDANLGAAGGNLELDDGTLITTADVTSTRALILGDGGGTLAPVFGRTLSWGGLISGAGSLHKLDDGTLVLTADNTYTGGTTLTGMLRLGNGGATGSITGDILNNGILVVERNNALDLAGVISGSGVFIQEGSGTTTLLASNTYSGGTVIDNGVLVAASDDRLGAAAGPLAFGGGTLRTGAGFDSNRAVTLNAGGGSIDDAADARFAGVIAGSGGLTKLGAGTTVLAADNTYTGGTTISAGTLQVGEGGTSGSLLGDIVNNAALVFDRSDASSFAGVISGSGDVTVQGGGTLTLSGSNSYSGANGTQVRQASVLSVSADNNLGAAGTRLDIEGGSTLRLNANFTLARPVELTGAGFGHIDTLANAITATGIFSGSAGLQKDGSGVLVMTGDSNYSGGTLIAAGTLQLGAGGTSGSVVGNIDNAGALVVNRSDSLTLAGVISGAGTLTQAGTGTLLLSGDNSFAGGTTISAGTLQLGEGGTRGSVLGNINNNAALVFNRSDALVFAGAISGSGTLTQLGPGILTLSGSSSLSGLSTVAAGTLWVTGSLAGPVQVNGGGTLGGTGSIGGAVNVADGGHLAPGTSPGTLTLASLTLNPASFLDYELGQPNLIGGGINDLTEVGGALVLDGTLNISDLGGFGNGVYRLFNYGGTLTDNGLLFGSLPSGFSGADLLLQTSTLNQVNLVVTVGGFSLQFWDGPNESANGAIDGGTSQWNTSSTRWTNADGDANATWQGGFAVFQGTAGTVTLAQDINLTGAQFRSDGYVIDGAGFGLAGASPDTVLRVDPAVTATIAASLNDGAGGSMRLMKTDFGTLVLSGVNTYTGGTAIDGGRVRIAADTALGAAAGALAMDGGELATTADISSARAVTLAADGGTFAPVAGTTLTLGGAINGVGSLEKIDAGTLVLTGSNAYAGGSVLRAGVLAVNADAALGAGSGGLLFDGGALRLDASFNLTALRAVTLETGGGTVDTNTHTSTWAQAIQGSGALTKTGAGSLILTGDNLYTGGTTLSAGTLQLGDGGTSGSVLGNIINHGALVYARSDSVGYAGVISGSGSLTQQGPGTLILTGDHGYTGGTTISAGTLQLGNNTATGSVQGNIVDNGALVFARSDDVTYAGVVSGTGTVSQVGPGQLTFTGNHSYSGGTSIATGAVLQLGDGGTSGSLVGDVLDNGTLVFNRSDNISFAGNTSGSGSLQKLGAGELQLLGNITATGDVEIDAGTLRVGDGGTVGAITGDIRNNALLVFDRGNSYQQGSVISGTGVLEQRGAGTLTLGRSNTYTGGTVISAGTLQVGNGFTGSIVGDVSNQGALVFQRNDDIVFAGVISGTGTLTQAGTGTLSLTGASTLTGLTNVASGALEVDGSLAGDANVATNATLGGIGSIAGLVTVADGGHLSPGDSPGTLTLGTLVLNNNSQLDYELGLPNIVGGGVNDLVSVTGNLTLDGVLNITDLGGFGNGVYRLFNYGGTLTDNGLLFGGLPSGIISGDLLLQTAISNQINLIVSQGGLGLQFWDGPNEVGNGVIDGGTSVWNTINSRWTIADGSVNAPWQSGFAVFQGTAGTVTLGENIALTGAQFVTDGYVIEGAGFSLHSDDTELPLRVDPGVTATINAAIVDGAGGAFTLVKRDAGTLVLGGNNSYGGGTRIDGGTVRVGADANLGLAGTGVALDGGTLAASASFTSNRAILLNADGGSFAPAAGVNLSLSGVVSGSGALHKLDAGTLTLAADNSYTGGTTIAAGTLQLGDGGTSGSVQGDVLNNGSLVFNRSNQRVVDGRISGTGSVTQQGSGITQLNAANDYSGGTFINGGVLDALADNRLGAASGGLTFNGGTLHTGAGFDSSRAVTLNAPGGTIEDMAFATFHGVFSGAGGLTKTGTGTTTLTADNTHAGITTISAGTLQLGNGGSSGAVVGNIVNNAALLFNRSDVYAYTGVISGGGDVSVLGGGTLTLSGANSYSSLLGTQVRGGSTLSVAGNGNLGAATTRVLLDNASTLQLTSSFTLTRQVVLEGAGNFNSIDTQANTVTVSDVVSGAAGLNKAGSGTLVLSAEASYTGGTQVLAGTLQLGNGGSTGSVLGNIANAGAVVFNRSDVSTYAGWISGSGSVSQNGTGTSVLTGQHSYTGGTTINAGTLQLGDGGSSGSLVGDITNNAALVFNRNNAVAFAGLISGNGTLTQAGSGKLTLSAANTYTGLTTVAAGSLLVTGSLAGPVQVNAGGLLGGTGNIAGAVTIADGGQLAPGTSPGTLTLGALLLNPNSQLVYELGLPDVVGGGINDLTSVAGALTLDGVLNISDLGGFGNGVYRLFDYGGTLTDNGLLFGSLPAGILSSELLVQTSIINQVNLIVTQGGFSLQFWDGPNTVGNGVIDGGTALWNTLDTRWTNADGVVNAPWQSGFAVFQGGAGTVTLGEDIDLAGAQFRTDGYVVDGAGFHLSGTQADTVLRVDPGVTATLNVSLWDGASATQLVKTDFGTLVLTGTQLYSGGTLIRDGVLRIDGDAALGAAGSGVRVEGATLATTSTTSSNRSFDLRAEGVSLAPAAGTQLTLAGVLSGPGSVEKIDAGTLVLSGTNTYTGGTHVRGGVLAINTDSNLGDVLGGVSLDDGTLRLDADASLLAARAFTLASGGGTFDSNGHAVRVESAIQGSGALTKSGAGTLLLVNDNGYTGGTTISAGLLQIGEGGSSGRVVGNIQNDAALSFARGDVLAYDGVISGAGLVTQAGPGTLIFSADHGYTGGTLIAGGILQLGDGGSTGSVTGDIVDNGQLVFARGDDLGFGGVISGSGTVTQQGPGTLTFTTDHSYTGLTSIRAGTTLQLGAGGTSGSVAGDVLDDGLLIFNRSDDISLAAQVSGSGRLTQQGPGMLTVLGNINLGGPTTVAGGSLRIGDGGVAGVLSGSIVNNSQLIFEHSDLYTQAGVISGSGAVEQRGTGTLLFTGAHNYSGGTVISAGTLQVGQGLLGSVMGNINNNAALVFARDDNIVFDGVISGSGALTQAGAGTLTVTAAHTFSGLTTVGSGRLQVDGSLSGDASVLNGATLGGFGAIGGLVTIADGGHIAPGDSPGTLTVGSLQLGAGSILDYELGLAGIVGGGVNDLIDIAGNLTLDGTLNVSNLGGFGNGVYRLMNYGGTLIDNGLLLGLLPTGVTGSDALVQTSIATEVNLVINRGGFALQFWDGNNSTGNGAVDGGTSIWDNNQTHWTGVNGATNINWQSGFAVFTATPGTVTLGDDVHISGMQFRSGGYQISGAGFSISADAADTIVRVDNRGVASIDAAIVDGTGVTARLVKRDLGLLILGGDNTYSGGTLVTGGVVQIAADNHLGAAGTTLTLDHGTLLTTADISSTRPVTLGAGHGVFNTQAGTTLSLGGAISGVGGLSKTGDGTLVLSGDNTYGVGTFVGAGVLEASRDANLGAANAGLLMGGGTLRWGADFDLGSARVVAITGVGSFDTQAHTGRISQTIIGDGALIKQGSGTLILSGNNEYAGGTGIAAGTLQVGDGGSTGSLMGDVENLGTLAFARSDDATFAGTVIGSGNVIQQGPGLLTLVANQGYTGGTTIAAGRLMLGQGGSTGSVLGNIGNQGELIFNRSDDVLYDGVVSGTGALTKLGNNTLVLSADQQYTGLTTISAGQLRVGNGGASGSLQGAVANAGELAFFRTGTLNFAGLISGVGSLRQLGSGTVVLSGANSYSGGTFVDGGVLSVGNDAALGAASGEVYFNGGTLRLTQSFNSDRLLHIASGNGAIDVQGQATRNKLSQNIDGSGMLLKTGEGVLILNHGGSHTGGTQVLAGTLVVGDSAHPQAVLRNGDVGVASGAALGGYGAVIGNVHNLGLIGIGNALPALATEPDAVFTIAGTLNNQGTVSMLNGVAADQLLIKQGAFVANGGLLQIETVLNGGELATQTDQLITDGLLRAGSGVTGLQVNAVGGAGQVTNGDGIRVVDVTPGGSSAAGAFVLTQRVVAGSHEYLLFHGGLSNPGDGDWYLRSESDVIESPTPILRPEVGGFLGNRFAAERMLIHTLHQRQGEPDPSLDSDEEGRGPLWANVYGINNRTATTDGLVRLEGESWRLQTGMDLLRKRGAGDSVWRTGAYLQYGQATTDADAAVNPAHARGKVDGYGVGIYASWLGDAHRQLGAYVDAWAQYGRFENEVMGSGGFLADYDGSGWAASLEAGYGIALGKRVVLEPQLQYVRINLDTDTLTDSSQTRITDASRSDWVARVGTRLYGVPEKSNGLSPFVEVNWWRRAGNGSMFFNQDRMDHLVPLSITTVDVGVQGIFGNGWQVWMRLGSAVNEGAYHELNGMVGARFAW